VKRHSRTKSGKARVVIVDDHPIVREHLGRLIHQQDDMELIGAAEDPQTCKALLQRQRADLALVDLSLRNAHGLDLIKDLKASYPDLPTLVLSMHDESLYAERALRAGARGYVTKQETSDVILGAIRTVLDGEMYVSPKMALQLVGAFINSPRSVAKSGPIERLTDREIEIFQLLGGGHATRQIAEMLHIDVKTVETHLSRLREKLNVRTVEELREHALNHRLPDSAK
jgi:DNA-binding NarL/FixJ family response regulator